MANLKTYMQQLDAAASAANINLEDACARAGVNATTLMRWRSGAFKPSEKVATKLFAEIAGIHGSTS